MVNSHSSFPVVSWVTLSTLSFRNCNLENQEGIRNHNQGVLMSYSYVGKFKENGHLFVLEDSSRDGRDFALWLSRQLIYSHKKGLSVDANSLPNILKPRHKGQYYTYEYPLVIKKAWLDRTVIHKNFEWFYCGSVHHHFINGFYGGLFSGVFNKLFSSWPATGIIFPPKFIPKGKSPDDYAVRQISQWTLNGLARSFRVFTLSFAAAFVYDFSEQIFKQWRNKDDFLNPVLSGAVTGSVIGIKRSWANCKCKSTAVLFAFFALLYEQMDYQNSKLNQNSFPNRNSAFFF